MCSNVPDTVKVERKQEENIRFTCVIDYDTLTDNTKEDAELKKLSVSLVKVCFYFKEFFALLSSATCYGVLAFLRVDEDTWPK